MASRKEQKERLKAERLQREREAAAAERRKRLVGYGAGGGLAVAAVVAVIVAIAAGGGGNGSSLSGGTQGEFPEGSVPPARTANLDQAARAAGCKLEDFEEEGNGHVEGTVDYKTNPPTSGDHNPIPAEDGAYTAAPETEALVHSLEHGRIVIQFDPRAPDSAKGDLNALFDELQYHVTLTPNETGMPFEVAATAWTHLLGCKQMDERTFDAIRAFYQQYVDQGPEFVP
jgi:hypothetical protein